MKWALGCVLWVLGCSVSQAALIDSVRVGDQAFLLSDAGKLYIYNRGNGSSVSVNLIAGAEPVSLDVVDGDAIYLAYSDRIEKRHLNGSQVLDPVSGKPLTNSFSNIQDLAVVEGVVYVSYNPGEDRLAQIGADTLSLFDIEIENAEGEPAPAKSIYPLSDPMARLVLYPGGTGNVLLSPDGKDLLYLPLPSQADGFEPMVPNDAKEVEVFKEEVGRSAASVLDTPDRLFVLGNGVFPEILMDNGSEWAGGAYAGWINGQEFHFLDQADGDGSWAALRDRVGACDDDPSLTPWNMDLIHYSTGNAFISRIKVTEAGYRVVHLWNGVAYLFRESGGVLKTITHALSDGEPFDDGHVQPGIGPADPILASQQVDEQQLAVADDLSRAYFLYQGVGHCDSTLQVYDYASKQWEGTIPLRWKADSIAMISGADTEAASDDILAVVYERSFNVYGRSQMLVSFIDINAANPAEGDFPDFARYGVEHSDLSLVQAGRYSVLFQMEVANFGSELTAVTPFDSQTFYESAYWNCGDEESGGAEGEEEQSCDRAKDIDFWRLRPEDGRLLMVSDGWLRNLSVMDAMDGMTFEPTPDTKVELSGSVAGPLRVSPGMEWQAMNLDGGNGALFHEIFSYANGLEVDYLTAPLEVATWSETRQGEQQEYSLYTLNGGGDGESSRIQRWQRILGDDRHWEAGNEEHADVPGRPVMVKVIDPANDALLVATQYENRIRFTPFDKALAVTPGGDGDGDDGDTGGGDSGSGGSGGGSNGFGSSGGGSVTWLLGLLVLAVGSLRRRH